MDIIFSPEAKQDLKKIFDHILEDSPQAAQNTLSKIQKSILQLKTTPHIGRPGRIPHTRELVTNKMPYIIPYKVYDNHLAILRVYHSSRKWPSNF